MDTKSLAQAISLKTYQPRPGIPQRTREPKPTPREAREELEYLTRDQTWGRYVLLYGYRPGLQKFAETTWQTWISAEAERLAGNGREARIRWEGRECALWADDPRDTPSRQARVRRLAAVALGK